MMMMMNKKTHLAAFIGRQVQMQAYRTLGEVRVANLVQTHGIVHETSQSYIVVSSFSQSNLLVFAYRVNGLANSSRNSADKTALAGMIVDF
jgi:hypothetical protein